MSNVELTKYYMGLQHTNEKMPETSYFDIIKSLDSFFKNQWTWELADETMFEDTKGKSVMTTVTVYTPGRITTGRSVCKITDYHENHLHAILDACKWFIDTSKIVTAPQQTQPVQSMQMSPEQIMAATQQANTPAPAQEMVNTAAQFYNYKDNQGMPATGVPFDSMTNNCNNELQQEMGMGTTPQPNTQQPPDDYDTPKEHLKGFSQHQIDRIKKFQSDFDITNDEMFGNYVNTWDNALSHKRDITPMNVESFLTWAENLGKMGC